MDPTPGEFESLITNLFARMGLETRQTQASRDGGVDCVAFDPRPVFGGKVVIQAKRYPSQSRRQCRARPLRHDGNRGCNQRHSGHHQWTTSGYGRAAFDFANNKPLELLSGANLLYMPEAHAGLEAKTVMPQE